MKRLVKVFFIFLPISLSIVLDLSGQSTKINDIISPLKLTAGRTDTVIITDLFYSAEYNLEFKKSKNIKMSYDKNSLRLILTPDANYEGVTTIDFSDRKKSYTIPIFVKKITKQRFSFESEKKYKSIFLFGSFNNWNRHELEMKDTDGDGIFNISIPLEAGRYEYKFSADGEELLDPENENSIPNGIGGTNSLLIVKNQNEEKFFLHKDSYSKGKSVSKFSFYLESEKPHNISSSNILVLLDNHKINSSQISVKDKKISVSIANAELFNSKMLRVVVLIGGVKSNLQMVPLSNGQPAGNQSFNWYDGIIYSLMIDRFFDGNKENNSPVKNDSVLAKANYMGGDFAGITKKIEDGYFDSIGVNTIWISPVNDNPDEAYKEFPPPHRWYTGYHGYWPISDTRVEEKFGSFNDLKELINAAHKHQIKILLDFVSHHVHQEHPFYKEHPEWFGKLELPDGRLNLRLWDEQRLTTWFEPYLPSFDFINSDEATNVVSDNAVWWLKQTGADGFRHDAVKHVPNKFWRTLTNKLKKEIVIPDGNEVYQIGETFGNYDLVSSYVNNGQLSSQFNFELYNTAQAVFIDPKRSFIELDAEMNKTLDVYGPLHLMGNIMDSHDKNRFMAYADGAIELSQWSAIEEGWSNPPEVKDPYSYKKAELYLAYMLTIPGLPVIYYGSEFGMTGLSDPDNRRMMRFGKQLNTNEEKMLTEVNKVVKARSNHSALRYGDFYTIRADDDLFAYLRSDFSERILIVLNKSDERKTLDIRLPHILSSQKAVDCIDNSVSQIVDNKLNISLEQRGWKILILK